MPAFAGPVHGQTFRHDGHCNFPHGVRGFASEEPAVNRWRHDNYTAFPALRGKDRKQRLDRFIQTLGVDALHEEEALGGRGRDGAPPDRACVVDEDVDAAESLQRDVLEGTGNMEGDSR